MSIVDLVIVILIIFGALIGFKRGFTKELVNTVGFIAVLVLAYIFKNPISMFLFENLPFFKFGGAIKGVTVLNILLYEVIAFLVVLFVLIIIWKILMLATSIFEKILTMTIVLGIPSKLLGMVLGALKWCIISFIVVYVLSLPFFNMDLFQKSKFCNGVLKYTPILSSTVDKGVKVIEEFGSLKDKYKNTDDANEFNLETLDLFLKYKVVKIDSVTKLAEMNKIKINGIESVIEKYREA